MPTLNLQVGANADDVYHVGSSAWNAITTNAWIGNNGGSGGDRWSRFTNVTIPQGATITAATMQFFSTSAGAVNGFAATIKCDASDNSTVPADGSAWSARTFTTGTAWTMSSPYTTGAFITTADITAEIQAIINRAGWVSGNAISVDVRNNASPSNAYIAAQTHEGSAGNSAKLDITYSSGVVIPVFMNQYRQRI